MVPVSLTQSVLRKYSWRNMAHTTVTLPTKPFEGQQPGTSGLRKPVQVFKGENYTENFVQSILNYIGEQLEGSALVIGGDGRYYCKEAIRTIIRMCAANGATKLYVGQNGILSTPAASHLIRKYQAIGGIILTASHNPGGPDKDFGIKFNTANGGAAPTNVTQRIYELTQEIRQYRIVPELECPLEDICSYTFQVNGKDVLIEVIDPVLDYLLLMKEIFDFPKISRLLVGDKDNKPFRIVVDCMHGVTGPYAKEIFINELRACDGSVINAVPLEDFGGGHPDPNLVYAKGLVEKMESGNDDFGVAFDGDGDRNMILGRNAFFVTPSDSLAVLAAHLHCIPYFQENGIKGFARSMPTAAAVDRVASAKRLSIFETPTGWKFFCNLLDAGKISLCGEESFGTGSPHIREKDGIWAALAWLSVVAHLNCSVEGIVTDHWKKFGRNYALRYDYEECNTKDAEEVMAHLQHLVDSPNFKKSTLGEESKIFVVKHADNFSYQDPVEETITDRQGIRIIFEDGSRAIFRLSGTGSKGATIRVYFEFYETDPSRFNLAREVVMAELIEVALKASQINELTKRNAPTVIT